ncbi:MAG: hypothetical protein HQK96_08015 [Nitrospirae bacterium]|nr:hypothetical protein [Nitrospirota bacterium]
MKLGREYAVKMYKYRSSSDTSVVYEVLVYPDGSDVSVSCNCCGWTRRIQPDGSRKCRHTLDVTHHDGRSAIGFEDLETGLFETRKVVSEEIIARTVVAAGTETLDAKVSRVFGDLRGYGFIALQGVTNTKRRAIEFLTKKADEVSATGVPVTGMVWIDRDTRRKIKRHDMFLGRIIVKSFYVGYAPYRDTIEGDVAEWVKEVFDNNDFVCVEYSLKNTLVVKTV